MLELLAVARVLCSRSGTSWVTEAPPPLLGNGAPRPEGYWSDFDLPKRHLLGGAGLAWHDPVLCIDFRRGPRAGRARVASWRRRRRGGRVRQGRGWGGGDVLAAGGVPGAVEAAGAGAAAGVGAAPRVDMVLCLDTTFVGTLRGPRTPGGVRVGRSGGRGADG